MDNLSSNLTNEVNNMDSQHKNYDDTKDKLLSNLKINMNEQRFYDLFMMLGKNERDGIIKELQLFTGWTRSFGIFLNNICATLSDENWAFWDISREIINYLEYLAENDVPTLEEIYKKLSQNIEQ